jgi:hypothetical protein
MMAGHILALVEAVRGTTATQSMVLQGTTLFRRAVRLRSRFPWRLFRRGYGSCAAGASSPLVPMGNGQLLKTSPEMRNVAHMSSKAPRTGEGGRAEFSRVGFAAKLEGSKSYYRFEFCGLGFPI